MNECLRKGPLRWLFTFYVLQLENMDIWKHGTYLDTWSIVHLFSGFLLSGICFFFGFNVAVSLAVSTAVLLLWEVFEWILKIIEPSINVIVDIVVGLAGFAAGVYVFFTLELSFAAFFYPVAVATAALALWGFLDFLKRGYR